MTIKQLLKSIVFLVLFGFLSLSLTYCLRTNGSVKDRMAGFYAEKKNTLDAVIIGSSPVFPYYIGPKMFADEGIVCYPVSTNLQRPAAQRYLTEEVLSRQAPKLFIYEVRMYTGREEYLLENMAYTRGVTDNMQYSVNRLKTIEALLDQSGLEYVSADSDVKKYTYWFDLFKYHSNYRSLYLLSQWKTWRFSVPDPLKGYQGMSTVAPCTFADVSGVTETEPIPAVQEKRLAELLDYLRDRGQDALFVVSPFNASADEMKMFNYIGEIVRGKGYAFLNMNTEMAAIGLDPGTDFGDYGTHVNAKGAEKVTAYFEHFLKEDFDLPDRRGDSTYASWQQSAEYWKTEHGKMLAEIASHIEEGSFAEKDAEAE